MQQSRDPFESTSWETRTSATQGLSDLCSECFSMIFHIRAGNDPGHIDSLRKETGLLLEDLDRRARRSGYPEEDAKAARYALCALIDETILNSHWTFKDQWADRPLQLEYFGDHMAGERFFDLLQRIRQKGSRKVDLQETFCMALILGFQGKYKLRGGEELRRLISELVAEVHSSRGGEPRELSPHGKIPVEAVERPAQVVPRWVWITGLASVVLVILAFVIFKLWLGSSASEAAARMIL
ncbi:MAG: DotU family type IV/VI secretion system protein [Acidobacteria bacterium]|nr:DotU family type IV/VI secretion system protein [Acidobacteriota bacterium]